MSRVRKKVEGCKYRRDPIRSAETKERRRRRKLHSNNIKFAYRVLISNNNVFLFLACSWWWERRLADWAGNCASDKNASTISTWPNFGNKLRQQQQQQQHQLCRVRSYKKVIVPTIIRRTKIFLLFSCKQPTEVVFLWVFQFKMHHATQKTASRHTRCRDWCCCCTAQNSSRRPSKKAGVVGRCKKKNVFLQLK